MAEGTGLRLEEHALLTLHEELYHRGLLPPVPHCTAVAVGKPQTRGEAVFVGQTWDWMPSVAGMSRMLQWRRSDGPSLLAYAFPGLWVGAGLNSNGLALCWTSADLGKKGQSPRIGLPSYVILAHLLYQENLDAVREAARRDKHAGWFTFVMADSTGRLMNIEGSPQGIEVQESTGQLIRVGFGTNRMCQTPMDAAVKLHPRCVTMEGLLSKASGHVDLAVQTVITTRHLLCHQSGIPHYANGMQSLEPDTGGDRPELAVGYAKQGNTITRCVDEAQAWKHGAGAFRSNVRDFSRWAEALVNRRLGSEQTEAPMWAIQPLKNGQPTTLGLGFTVENGEQGFKV